MVSRIGTEKTERRVDGYGTRLVLLAMLGLLSGLALGVDGEASDEDGAEALRVFEVTDGVSIGVLEHSAAVPEQLLAYDVVVDLRYPYEGVYAELGRLRNAGVEYVNIPTSSARVDLEQVTEFGRVLAEHRGKHLLLHDSNGHRAAMVWAAYLLYSGEPLDAALSMVEAVYPADELRPKLERFAAQIPEQIENGQENEP